MKFKTAIYIFSEACKATPRFCQRQVLIFHILYFTSVPVPYNLCPMPYFILLSASTTWYKSQATSQSANFLTTVSAKSLSIIFCSNASTS